MTNYEVELNKINKHRLASLLSQKCGNCPLRYQKYSGTSCMDVTNIDKSCYLMVLNWLNQESEDEEIG